MRKQNKTTQLRVPSAWLEAVGRWAEEYGISRIAAIIMLVNMQLERYELATRTSDPVKRLITWDWPECEKK
jgi:hypothetical protein